MSTGLELVAFIVVFVALGQWYVRARAHYLYDPRNFKRDKAAEPVPPANRTKAGRRGR